MSLLTMARTVAAEAGFPKPSSIISNTDLIAVRILASINRAGKHLRDIHDWTVLVREHTFTTVNGTAEYAFPSDFDRFLMDTEYDRTNTQSYSGPLTAAEWQAIKSGGLPNTGITPAFRVRVNAFHVNEFVIDPTPAVTGDTQVYEYVSNGWVKLDGNDARTTEFEKSGDTAADADISLIKEDLIEMEALWRFRRIQGLPFAGEQIEAERAVMNEMGRDGGQRRLRLGSVNSINRILAAATPDTGFGS